MVGSMKLPLLTLTADEVASLRATAAALEAEVIAEYEDFLGRQRRRVDRSKWKHIKSDGDLDAHHEIRTTVDALGFMSSSPRHVSPTEPMASRAAESSVGRVLVVGSVPGSVDDALFGSSFTDTVSLRMKEAYQRDFLDDSAVLYTIEGPTLQDPFNFLGITWHLRKSVVAKPRDCLLLQQTHITTLSTGERVGVSLRHSIEHRELASLAAARTVLCSVSLFRQLSVGTVEVFGLEVLADGRRTPDTVQRIEAARDLLVNANACDSGNKKKLHWLMRRRHSMRRSQSLESDEDYRRCLLCAKSTRGLFAATGSSCQLCSKHVCSRCTMTLDIVVDAATANVVAKPFGFCIECILHTKTVSAHELAWNDVRRSSALAEKRPHPSRSGNRGPFHHASACTVVSAATIDGSVDKRLLTEHGPTTTVLHE